MRRRILIHFVSQYLTIGELAYIADSGFVKISVALLLLRVSVKAVYRYIILCSIFIVAVVTVAIFLAVALQCRPLSLAWDPTSATGTCMAPIQVTRLGYVLSAVDIYSDCLYALLPIPMLWNVQMTTKAKMSICLVLGVGVM